MGTGGVVPDAVDAEQGQALIGPLHELSGTSRPEQARADTGREQRHGQFGDFLATARAEPGSQLCGIDGALGWIQVMRGRARKGNGR
jgi:hypothetical protein